MPPKAENIIGRRFGHLVVLAQSPHTTVTRWHCRCDCGQESIVFKTSLASGRTKSCGCQWLAKRAVNLTFREPKTHGACVAGSSLNRTYRSWGGAKARCLNPDARGYENYGGRGITMSQEWIDSFEAFLRDMGPRPEGKTLERKDNNGPYSAENCRWATPTEQARNRRPFAYKRTRSARGRFAVEARS